MKKIVGITGGIASGKSVVSDRLIALGATVIDADCLAREVVAEGSQGEKLLKSEFPSAFATGKLDRKILREIVFADENRRKKLNEITHPLIETLMRKRINDAPAGVVFLVVPLMFETEYHKFCDYIVTVSSDEKVRARRVTERNPQISLELAFEMINAQTSETERNARADEIIVNDGTLDQLSLKADALFAKFRT